ncbi:MAG: thioesterase [Olsenella sp.]|nr:thioesterase [Olsenella sp.]MCI1289542.1 thioesterase [Olsenella sp.]
MYSYDSRVRYSECAADGRLSVLGLVNLMQDCSTFQCEHVGLGLDDMRRNHYAWFLSAWQIQIDDLPSFGEEITTSTWSHGTKRLLAYRDFTLGRRGEPPCVLADSLWFVFDTELGRPVKVPERQMVYVEDTPRVDLPPTSRKIAVSGDFTQAAPITVTRQHLDTNRHVNNAQYIQMALDALDELGLALIPWRITVQYEAMALLGDVLVPQVFVGDHARTVRLAKPDSPDGEFYATVRIEECTEAQAE